MKRQISGGQREGAVDSRDGRGREDALFRFFYSIMQINVRHIKLSMGGGEGTTATQEKRFLCFFGNKSLPAPIFLFFPPGSLSTALLFPFVAWFASRTS